MIVVEATGPLALVQDLGRAGLSHLGVSPSGAADRAAHRLANRLVGNPEGDATIEVTLGGLSVRATATHWVAVTGAPATVLVNDRPTASHGLIALPTGDRLTVLPPAYGVRSYLAVRGGITVDPVLGSRATDLLSGIGPAPLQPGDALPVGRPGPPLPGVDLAPPRQPSKTLAMTSGPRRDWFTDQAWADLVRQPWTVSPDGNRVGVRLEGGPLVRRVTDELPSEGLIRGAVQVPASGQPLIFLADHPVTGGYPVIAVLTDHAADHAAQLRPGDRVRFAPARLSLESWP
jgi:biotin-dependent carboxylase-like uncharacterized protein